MLGNLKRWIAGEPLPADIKPLVEWAERHQHTFKTVRDEPGGVVECVADQRCWRLEWGEPQRRYFTTPELRLREELELPDDFQMMVIANELAEKLETLLFERFTEAMQTEIDYNMPEEMRWLATFAKLNLNEYKSLKPHIFVFSSFPQVAETWLNGEMTEALEKALNSFLHDGQPFVLMILKGRLYLRAGIEKIDEQILDQAHELFAVAAQRAKALTQVLQTIFINTDVEPAETPTAWQTTPSMLSEPKP